MPFGGGMPKSYDVTKIKTMILKNLDKSRRDLERLSKIDRHEFIDFIYNDVTRETVSGIVSLFNLEE